MKTKIILLVIALMTNGPGIMQHLVHKRTGGTRHHKDFASGVRIRHPAATLIPAHHSDIPPPMPQVHTDEQNGSEIVPDFAYGKWYMEEYMVDLFDLHDSDADHMNRKRTKGYTRNYFSTLDGGIAKLLKTTQGASRLQYVGCEWYVDGKCVNEDDPASEFFFKMHEGSYKIEARHNDTTLISFTAVFPEVPEVIFEPTASYDGEFGFDDNRYEAVARLNQAEYLDAKYKYAVPFVSMLRGQAIDIDARVMYAEDAGNDQGIEDIVVSLDASSPGIVIGRTDSKGYHRLSQFALSDLHKGRISLRIQSDRVMENASVTARIGKRVVGKINIEVRERLAPLKLKFVQVIVNDRLGKDVDMKKEIPLLDELLNRKSYNQAFVQWNISDDVKILRLQIDKDEVKLLDVYKAAIKHYKDHGLNTDNETVVFVAGSDVPNDASGYAYLSRKGINPYAIVRSDVLEYKSVAHELGHNLGLKDLSFEHKSYFFDTDNFMDYYSTYGNDNRNMFWKYQWDHIYDRVYKMQHTADS